MKRIVLATGGFDPAHSGHVAYLEAAKKLGDILIVGLNSDEWLIRKKGRAFMPFSEREAVLRSMRCVDEVIKFDDSDNSAKMAVHHVRRLYPHDHIIFANGGDRTKQNIPEMDLLDLNLRFDFGVGGNNKANSSSWILEEWKSPRTDRDWGYYRVLHSVASTLKVKELTVAPGKWLSMQRHNQRSEFWFVASGTATVYTLNVKSDFELMAVVNQHGHVWVDNRQWHQLRNEHEVPLKVVEIQFGTQCEELDIERQQ
jgi:D-beta-D-heptose 7-phosphate kinase/D-beta-D-heptose 1-phosphate adenosyltransferase